MIQGSESKRTWNSNFLVAEINPEIVTRIQTIRTHFKPLPMKFINLKVLRISKINPEIVTSIQPTISEHTSNLTMKFINLKVLEISSIQVKNLEQ
ncbi:hypothetical protein M0804_009139 [Polistes exclamans]|nr:hypothetical protein M0804_009139 [Polistes exclamans]